MAAHSQLERMALKGTQQGMRKELEGMETEKGGGLARHAGADWRPGNAINFSPVVSPMLNSSGFNGTSPCPAAEVCDWKCKRGGEKMGNRETRIISKPNRMLGGTADNWWCFFCATDWLGKVGGCDGGVSRSCTGAAGARGHFQHGVYGVIFWLFACRVQKQREEETCSL